MSIEMKESEPIIHRIILLTDTRYIDLAEDEQLIITYISPYIPNEENEYIEMMGLN